MTAQEAARYTGVLALDLETKAKAGDAHAMVRFAWVAAWKALCKNPVLTPRAREKAFALLQKEVKFYVNPQGAPAHG